MHARSWRLLFHAAFVFVFTFGLQAQPSAHLTLQDLLSPRVMFALEMASKPLADRHGAPLRLIDPARYGYKSAKLITSIQFVAEGKGSMACDLGPYYSPGGDILAGYDHPLDMGAGVRKKIKGGEITEY